MKIPKPFMPLRAERNELNHTVHIVGRDYTFGADGLLTSVISQGHQLLAAPVRLVMEEDGKPSVWKDDYITNESARNSAATAYITIAGVSFTVTPDANIISQLFRNRRG